MSDTLNRRHALKFMGAPLMLPLGGGLAGSLLTGCGGGGDDDAKPAPSFASASFVSMAAPSLSAPADMAKTLIDYSMQQNVYQSALHAGANIVQQSLLDWLR